MQSEQSLVEKLRRVKATGRVVLEMKPGDQGVSALPDLRLEDGDRIFVPFTPSTVSVVGSVYNQSSFVFKDNTRIADYLKLAGGGNRDSDTKHMFILRANGTVVSREGNSGIFKGDFSNLRAYPGDMLIVPAQLEKGTFIRGLKDWSQIISQFGLGVAAAYVFTK
jgi:protein involved in polysaccharide export with SLBB domain